MKIAGFDCVNVWEYPSKELEITRVDANHHPELFKGLQVTRTQLHLVSAVLDINRKNECTPLSLRALA